VYLQTARYLLTKEGANALAWKTGLRQDSNLQLPSWVPDWTSTNVEKLLDLPAMYFEQPLYSACGRNQNFVWHTTGDVNGHTLSLLAFCIDTVTTIPVNASTVRSDTLALYGAFLKSNVGNITADLSDVIWRVPIADQGLCHVGVTPSRSRVPQALPGAFHESIAHASSSETLAYLRDFEFISHGRKAFITQAGRAGLGPESAAVGDGVYIIQGVSVPTILREAGNGQYRMVGEAYVYGVMDGEAMEGDPKLEWVEIV